MKLASRSFGEPYTCKYPWPDDCKVQCGGSEKRGYFIESYPQLPSTMIRSDSKISIEDAEQKAWNKYQSYLNCPSNHSNPDNFEKRDYTNGVGFCKQCGLFASKMFEPSEICVTCGVNTYYGNTEGKWYCESCFKKTPKGIEDEKFFEEFKKITPEEFREALSDILNVISKV
jgi:hypothetical protein